jgi:hypothetical protein
MEEEKEEEGGEGEGGRVGGRTLLIMDQEREGRGWQLRPLLICLLAKFFSSNWSIPKKGHTGNTQKVRISPYHKLVISHGRVFQSFGKKFDGFK